MESHTQLVFWTSAKEEHLMKLVRIHEHIYQNNHRLHADKYAVDNAWREIAREVGAEVGDCQKRWKTIRDRYVRNRRKWQKANKSGAGASSYEFSPILTQLSWLSDFIKHRAGENNYEVLKTCIAQLLSIFMCLSVTRVCHTCLLF